MDSWCFNGAKKAQEVAQKTEGNFSYSKGKYDI